jgi:tetratricopeptide (TPR) repeat protein
MGTERIKAVIGAGPVQLDDRLQLEYLMPRVMDQPREERLVQIYGQVLVHHEPASKILMGPAKADQELMARYDVSRSLFYRAAFPAPPEMAGSIDSGFLAQLWSQMLAFCGPVFPRKFAAKNYAVVLARLGEDEFLAGRTGDAIKILAQAFELDPENVEASHRLITYYQDRGDLETAVAWARLVIEVRPGDPLANTVLAFKARSEKDLEGAERYLLAAIDGMPEFHDYRLNYGLFLAQLGRFAEAEGQLRKAVELKPDSREALQVLARVLKDEGKNKEAGKFEQRAAALQAGTGGPKAP